MTPLPGGASGGRHLGARRPPVRRRPRPRRRGWRSSPGSGRDGAPLSVLLAGHRVRWPGQAAGGGGARRRGPRLDPRRAAAPPARRAASRAGSVGGAGAGGAGAGQPAAAGGDHRGVRPATGRLSRSLRRVGRDLLRAARHHRTALHRREAARAARAAAARAEQARPLEQRCHRASEADDALAAPCYPGSLAAHDVQVRRPRAFRLAPGATSRVFRYLEVLDAQRGFFVTQLLLFSRSGISRPTVAVYKPGRGWYAPRSASLRLLVGRMFSDSAQGWRAWATSTPSQSLSTARATSAPSSRASPSDFLRPLA